MLILDEATSALDERSQKIVQKALNKIVKNRTAVVIAHRLSTVNKCDKIVVIHKGVLAEEGTYKELISK